MENFDSKDINTRCVHLHLLFRTFLKRYLSPFLAKNSSNYSSPQIRGEKGVQANRDEKKKGESVGERKRKKKLVEVEVDGGERDRYKSVSLIFHATAMESLFLPRKRSLIYM